MEKLTIDGIQAELANAGEDGTFKDGDGNYRIVIKAKNARALENVSKWISKRWRRKLPKVALINNRTVETLTSTAFRSGP
jgi:hypothetical protein